MPKYMIKKNNKNYLINNYCDNWKVYQAPKNSQIINKRICIQFYKHKKN